MKLVLDTHVHTIASGHAFSTVHDYVSEAVRKGIEMFALTDHGPAMPGGPHLFHLGNQRVIPREINGIKILRGVEANIVDYDGNIDVPEKYLKGLDIVIASLHDVCIKPGTVEDNTGAILGAMDNKYVDIIAHPGNPGFPLDYEKLLKKAKEKNILIEINNTSFISPIRRGSAENCIYIARRAKELGVKVIAGSDAHISFDIGKFDKVIETFNLVGMPEELIMNTSCEKLLRHLKAKGKNVDEVFNQPVI